MPDKENFNAVITPDERKEDMDSDYVVRRLTPLECNLLQGFPVIDGVAWTAIPGTSDTAQYKQMGNSLALPQWQIIMDNMKQYLPDGATMGGLFSGVGGFELCWERTFGKGTAKWSSEIDAAAERVMKYHFGDEEEGIEGDIEKYLERPKF